MRRRADRRNAVGTRHKIASSIYYTRAKTPITLAELAEAHEQRGLGDIYERGQELIRRDNEGLLKPVGSERTA